MVLEPDYKLFVRGVIVLALQWPFFVLMRYAGFTTLTWNRGIDEDYGIHKIANYRRHR